MDLTEREHGLFVAIAHLWLSGAARLVPAARWPDYACVGRLISYQKRQWRYTRDVVFASTVLAHLSQPFVVLAEIKRVLKSGGVIGLRGADAIATLIAPASPEVEQSIALLAQLMQVYGRSPTMGRVLRPVLHQAGFVNVKASAVYATHSEPESIQDWAEFMRAIFAPEGYLSVQLLRLQLASPDQPAAIVEGWGRWSQHPGAFLARTFCEAIAWKE